MTDERAIRLEREKTLLRYCAALETGDLVTVASILEAAESDPVLDTQLQEIHAVYGAEEETTDRAQNEAVVRELLRRHLPSGVAVDEETEIPALRVSDVLARMQSDGALRGDLSREAASSLQRLREADELLPETMSTGAVRQLFERLGVGLSERFQRLFRETALYLAMGRHQSSAYLAAARRQREGRASQDDSRGEDLE
jgi:hypothetical protein